MCKITYSIASSIAITDLFASQADSDGVEGGAEEHEDYGGPEPRLVGQQGHQTPSPRQPGVGPEVIVAPACDKVFEIGREEGGKNGGVGGGGEG